MDVRGSSIRRRAINWTLGTLAVLLGLVAVLGAAAVLLDASHFRGPLIRYFSARTDRQIRVEGTLEGHLFSLHPRLVAERVAIGNPPWTPPGTTAEIQRLTLVLDLSTFLHTFSIRSLEMQGATLHLARDLEGRANWQWTDPRKPGAEGSPFIRSLSVTNAHVEVQDVRRHLKFNGTVSARDVGTGVARPLRVDASGRLNDRPVTFAVNGDPLATASPRQAYRFAFGERSSGSLLVGRGSLPRPFDFREFEATFAAEGQDMRDLYFLTGVTLPDTGAYHLSGQFVRHDANFRFSDLQATSGQSDVRGTLDIAASSNPSRIDADLQSERFRLSDLGTRAAGRAPESSAASQARLLPDIALHLEGLRLSDAAISFHGARVEAGSVSFHAVAAKVRIEHGVLKASPVTASFFDQGTLTGSLKLDATKELPAADLDVRVKDLPLGQLGRKDPGQAPLEGRLQGRFILKGRGVTVRRLAANADGNVTVVLPRGTIRASLAELAGGDLTRSLGLLGQDKQTDIRCGIASFEVHDGTMSSQTLVFDTDPVLITGKGAIHLDSEALDFVLNARPKRARLVRVRAPLTVRGTLAHPSIGIEKGNAVAQAGAAVALGVALTPVAALLAFVDAGLAKDADCGALIAEGRSDGVRVKETPSAR